MPFHTEQYSSWFKRRPFALPYGTLAQWSVPPAHNRSYAGSNPARSTKRAAASGDLSQSVTSGSKKPSQANLTPIIPLVKPCSSTALRSYPSAYPSRLGSVIDNQFNCGGVIFFFGVSPLTAFHIPGKVPGTYRHRLHGRPAYRFPVIPGRLSLSR